MKLKAYYNAKTNVLKLQFDLKAQTIIRIAALHISAIIAGKDPTEITQEEGINRTDNLFEGLKLLELIAHNKSLQIRTTRQEAELSLGLLSFANLHFDGDGKVSHLMGKVVTMVARITPVVTSRLPMPPPDTVLERRVTKDETRKSLEILRSSPGKLCVHDSFLLARELRQISRPSRAVRGFITVLKMCSPLYWAMNEVLNPARSSRPQKKRKGQLKRQT